MLLLPKIDKENILSFMLSFTTYSKYYINPFIYDFFITLANFILSA